MTDIGLGNDWIAHFINARPSGLCRIRPQLCLFFVWLKLTQWNSEQVGDTFCEVYVKLLHKSVLGSINWSYGGLTALKYSWTFFNVSLFLVLSLRHNGCVNSWKDDILYDSHPSLGRSSVAMTTLYMGSLKGWGANQCRNIQTSAEPSVIGTERRCIIKLQRLGVLVLSFLPIHAVYLVKVLG